MKHGLKRELKDRKRTVAAQGRQANKREKKITGLRQSNEQWQKRSGRLLKDLKEYGRHVGDCCGNMDGVPCSCGLDKAIA